ncbi:MAG: arginine--tRNA ligase, partial [Bacteroidaceae bacterium]|nr:arginine--tRNA ligase [Bacteroidaceae bacterium]
MNLALEKRISEAARTAIEELYGGEVKAEMVQLQETRAEFEGQLTLVVFPFLKMSRKRPEDTAQEIGERLLEKIPDVVSRFNVIKGFLNLSINPQQWIGLLEQIWQDPTFGFVPVTETSPLVMIEYSSPNTNKPLHLGHVRNNLLGWALAQVMQANGNRVVKTNIVNDRGIHI